MSSGTSLAQNTGATGQFDITNNVANGNIKLTCKDAGGTNTRSATVSYAGIDMGSGYITGASSISATTFKGNLNGTITTTTLASTGTYYLPYLSSLTGTSNATVFVDNNIYFDRTNNTLNVPNLSIYGSIQSHLTISNKNIFGRTDGFAYNVNGAVNGYYPIGTVLEYKETPNTFISNLVFQYSGVLPALTMGTWIVGGNLILQRMTGTFTTGSYINLKITNAVSGIQQYPTTDEGGTYIPIPSNYVGDWVQANISGTLVCTINNSTPGFQGKIVMTTNSTAKKAIQVCFTKIA